MEEKPILGEGRLDELKKTAHFALLVGTYKSGKEKQSCEEHLDELERLGETYGLLEMEKMPTPLREISASTYLGKGKIQELSELCKEKKIDLVVFDDDISPQQQRNLEKIFEKPVIDRTELILGVFEQRAKTKEAKIQIDLARFHYQLPRLKRMWTHLSRQRVGGKSGGYLKGAGERQIEIDRQLLKDKISKLEKELKQVRKQRHVQRTARLRSNIPTFAIVGYTNAGKSTLLKALTQADVLVEDKLFATLDTTTRKFTLPNKQEILLIDTVGFIRKIPHTLVAAFKSTLEETLFTDILLHLIDVSSEAAEEQAEASMQVLKELKAEDKPTITVLNKIDAVSDRKVANKLKLQYGKAVFVSALKKEGFDDLLNIMMKEISRLRKLVHLKVPQAHYDIVARLMKEAKVISCDYEENDVLIEAEIPQNLEKLVKPFMLDK